MFSKTLLCLALSAAATSALADTVWLKNGDRLTGKIKFYDGGKLLLQTEYGGAIALDWSKIATLESDQELLIKENAVAGERAKALQPAEPGKVVLANGGEPKTIELASIKQILKPKPLVEDLVIKGNLDASLDYKRAERDTDDYDIDLKTQARHGLWRHHGEAERPVIGSITDEHHLALCPGDGSVKKRPVQKPRTRYWQDHPFPL